MVQNIKNSVARMAECQNGATAIIYALCIFPLTLMVGFAIDYNRMVSAKSHVQQALDAAVMASALDFARNVEAPEAQRLTLAATVFTNVFEADLASSNRDLSTVAIDITRVGEGGIEANVTSQLGLVFGGLFGREFVSFPARGAAEAAPPQDVEIVLALDNTTSMFQNNRFDLMRSAAKGFVNNVLDDSAGAGATSIGVVPWATLVNINSERPGSFNVAPAANRSPTAAGIGVVPNEPFEDRLGYLFEPEAEIAYTREALERDFLPVSWRGCIRSAPGERRVTNGGNVTRRLTDEPVENMRWHTALVEPELQSFSAPSGFAGDPGAIDASIQLDTGRILRCEQSRDGGIRRNVHIDVDRACIEDNGDGLGQVTSVEACVSDPNEFGYFDEGGEACAWQDKDEISPWTEFHHLSGPNQNCPVAMLGLSEDRRQIIDKLDEMHPVTGGTHMDLGLMWGLRILSPRTEWAGFFDQSRPSRYDDAGTRKVLVLLTDGQNTAPRHFEGYYGCNETSANARTEAGPCWRAPDVRNLSGNSLNNLTEDACEAIREDYGVEIFTIAVDITNGAAINLLADCAGEPANAFNISASEIDAVFESIAARQVRLTQ